ncbi:MAG: serine hydrolase [Acidobacteria bacterium]|nr:serine hydrolase [Acidobacteriota bacterium]
MNRKVVAILLFCVFAAHAQTTDWPTASPGSVGIDEKGLATFDAELASGKFGNVDGLTVIRHGKLVFDKRYARDYDKTYGEDAKKQSPLNAHDPTGPYNYYNSWWHPWYQRGDLHTLQSVSKTITSIIVGVARTRGDFPDIDTPALRYFDESKVQNVDDRKRRMTIRNLLTMSAGLDWNEGLPYQDPKNTGSQMEASLDWMQYTIDRPMAFEPGKTWAYNSGATQILAHVFHAATGQDIEEYAVKYLFGPLGIKQYYWKRSPSGLVDAEGGFYLRPRDLAKLWYLFLKNGVWDGKQIVSADWVKESVKPAFDLNGAKYGLKWWLYPYGKDNSMIAWSGSGFGGQMPMAFPDYDMVVVYTAWNVNPGTPVLRRRDAIDRIIALADATK